MHACTHGSWLQGISYAKLASLPPIIGLCTYLYLCWLASLSVISVIDR